MIGTGKRKLVLVTLFVVLANVLDLLSTYSASPDLAEEWNALNRVFGMGWGALISAKLIGGFIAVAGYAYYLRYRTDCYPPAGADRDTFYRHFALGRSDSQLSSGDTRHLVMSLGYFWTGMQLLVVWVAIDNMLLKYGWVFPMRSVSELGYHLFQSAIIGFIVLVRFHRVNYNRYIQRATAASAQPGFNARTEAGLAR